MHSRYLIAIQRAGSCLQALVLASVLAVHSAQAGEHYIAPVPSHCVKESEGRLLTTFLCKDAPEAVVALYKAKPISGDGPLQHSYASEVLVTYQQSMEILSRKGTAYLDANDLRVELQWKPSADGGNCVNESDDFANLSLMVKARHAENEFAALCAKYEHVTHAYYRAVPDPDAPGKFIFEDKFIKNRNAKQWEANTKAASPVTPAVNDTLQKVAELMKQGKTAEGMALMRAHQDELKAVGDASRKQKPADANDSIWNLRVKNLVDLDPAAYAIRVLLPKHPDSY